MVITYHGFSCFKVQAGDISIVFDLPSKKALPAGRQAPRFHTDIAFQSHSHAGHSGAEEIAGNKGAFLINGPGEYEVKEVCAKGVKTYHDSAMGKKNGINTAYIVRFEDIKLCFMGDYGEKELRPELKEAIGKIDIFFVPIGGETVLEPSAAASLINQIEPAIAIPMHYSPSSSGKDGQGKKKDLSAQAGNLKIFLAECGQKDVKPIEKLSIKKKDISENGTQVVVLEKQGA